jgi:hypothetical protein
MTLIEQAQLHYDGWRAAMDDQESNVENEEVATKATVLAGQHWLKLQALKCPSHRSAKLKLMVAFYYIRLNGPVGDEDEWDMVESALDDLLAEAGLPAVNEIGANLQRHGQAA